MQGFFRVDLAEGTERVVIHLDDAAATRVGPRTWRKRILRYGQWRHRGAPGGVLKVDANFIDRVVANFNERVWDHVYVPLGHPQDDAASVKENTGEVIALEHVEDDGLYALMEVAEDVAPKLGKEIKGASAGLLLGYQDHEVGGRGNVGPVLSHVALTNEPYIKGLGDFEPVELAEMGDAVLLDPVPEEETMDLEELIEAAKELGVDIPALQKAAKDHEELTAWLEAAQAEGAGEGATEEVKEEAEQELVASLAEALTGAGVLNLSEGQEPTLATVVGAVRQVAETAQESQRKLALSEAEAAVDSAIREGRALPSKRDALVKLYLSDPEAYEALLPESAIVDFSERGTQGDLGEPELGGDDTDTEIDRYAEMASSL